VRQHSFSGKSEDDNYLGKNTVLTFTGILSLLLEQWGLATSFLRFTQQASFHKEDDLESHHFIFLLLNIPSEY
jgi:hypothetical protein